MNLKRAISDRRRAQPFGLSRPFETLVLPQPHAPAAAVFVDELDARLFKGTSDFVRCFRATRDRAHQLTSNRAMVGSEIDECCAKSPCDHPSKARAALICRVVTNFSSFLN